MNYKVKGLLSYLLGWIPCVIILFCINDNTRDEYFNSAQALVLHVIYVLANMFVVPLSIIAAFSNPLISLPLTGCVSILYIVLIIMGCVKSYNEESPALPVIGDLTEKIFKTKLDSFSSNNNYESKTNNSANNDWNYDPETGEKIEK